MNVLLVLENAALKEIFVETAKDAGAAFIPTVDSVIEALDMIKGQPRRWDLIVIQDPSIPHCRPNDISRARAEMDGVDVWGGGLWFADVLRRHQIIPRKGILGGYIEPDKAAAWHERGVSPVDMTELDLAIRNRLRS